MRGAVAGSFIAVLALALASLAPVACAHPPLALEVGRVFDGTRWIEDATVVVRDGVVEHVGFEAPAGVLRLRYPDAVLTPGLIDLHSRHGLASVGAERHEAASPDLRVADAHAPDAIAREAFLRSGVTTAWLSPSEVSVLGGAGALVQPGQHASRVLEAAWGPTGSLSGASSVPDRAPTSLPERARLLARTAASVPVGGGRLRVVADDVASLRAAAALDGAAVVALPPSREALPSMLGADTFVLTGLGPDAAPESVRASLALIRAARLVGVGSGDAPAGPRAVRHAIARLVMAGLDPDTALELVTSRAAAIAGLPGARGTLSAGAVADMVLWTDHPASPAARPLVTWIAGEEAHRVRGARHE